MAAKRVKRVSLSERRLMHPVLAAAELMDIRLLRCSVKHNLTSPRNAPTAQIAVEGKGRVHKDHNRFTVTASFSLVSVSDDHPNEQLTLDCAFLIDYKITDIDGLKPENFNAFTKLVAMNIAWPYAREFIQNITSRLGVPTIRIPLYKPEVEDSFNIGD